MKLNLENFGFSLSRKYKSLILFLLFLSVVIGYIGRMSTSVALENIASDMGWSSSQQGSLGGILLGIFLVSYGFSNIFFSPNIDKYGTKVMLTVSILGWSFAIFLGAYFGGIYWIILISRLLLGLSQGVLFPVASKVTAGWFTRSNRGRANSIFMSGGPIGVAIAPILMSPLIIFQSWQFSFYIVALIGLVLSIPILLIIRDSPASNISIDKKRRNLDIKKSLLTLAKERDFQVVMIGFTAVTTVWWGISLWIPTYLIEVHSLNIGEMSYRAAIPYLGAVIGMFIGSWISDTKGYTKKIIMFSLLTSAFMIGILTIIPMPNVNVAIVILFLVFIFGQMAPPLFFTMLQEKVPEKTIGSATGLMNGIGNGAGVLGPVMVGGVIALTSSYNIGLLSLSVIAIFGLITFFVFDN
ncbi:MAG: MFS transporter [Thermoplasmatota archaeon]